MVPPSEHSAAIDALEARVDFLTAIIESLYRQGVLTDDALADVEKRFAHLARSARGSERGERYDGLVIATQILPMRASVVLGQAEADRRRRDMRDRTKIIERKAKEEGK